MKSIIEVCFREIVDTNNSLYDIFWQVLMNAISSAMIEERAVGTLLHFTDKMFSSFTDFAN